MEKEADEFPLHQSVKKNDYKKVKTLLKNGADINGKNNLGYTPLHLAVTSWNRIDSIPDQHYPKLKTTRTLIKAGADLNLRCYNNSLLSCAVQSFIHQFDYHYNTIKVTKTDFILPSYKIVQELILNGAPNTYLYDSIDACILDKMFTPLWSHYRTYMFHGKPLDTTRLLTSYIDTHPDIFLIAAAAKGDMNLIHHYFSPHSMRPQPIFIKKAFHIAALRNNVICLQALWPHVEKYVPHHEKAISKTLKTVQQLLTYATLDTYQRKNHQATYNFMLNKIFKRESVCTSYLHLLPAELRELLFYNYCEITK